MTLKITPTGCSRSNVRSLLLEGSFDTRNIFILARNIGHTAHLCAQKQYTRMIHVAVSAQGRLATRELQNTILRITAGTPCTSTNSQIVMICNTLGGVKMLTEIRIWQRVKVNRSLGISQPRSIPLCYICTLQTTNLILSKTSFPRLFQTGRPCRTSFLKMMIPDFVIFQGL